MTKRFLFNWAVWIGLVAGIYVLIYALSPLNAYGVMYASFVALPIFFTAGAAPKEFPNYACSGVMGVIWGEVYLWLITKLIVAGMNAAIAMALVVAVCVAVQCAIHFIPTGGTWINKPAAMFGGIAVTFSTGGAKAIPLAITLVLGAGLAVVCGLGTRLLDGEGKWKFPKKSNKIKI